MSSIEIQIVSENVKMSGDGVTATVSIQSQLEETPKGDKKPRRLAPPWNFQLTKMNGAWVITNVE